MKIKLIPINNDLGYDQSVILGFIRHYVCGICHGGLVKNPHGKTFKWKIDCRNPECEGGCMVERDHLKRVEELRSLQAREVMANFPEYFEEENQSSQDDDASWLTKKIGDK